MKKKIRNFFETGMILAIVLAFVIMPGVATTKSTLSEEILGISDAEIGWVPIDASGSHTIAGHEIFLHEIGQLVTLEIHVSSWDPNLLKTLQTTVDSGGYSNGVGGTLNPLGWPGSPEDGCFIDTSRPGYVFYGMTAIDAVYTGGLDYIWGATLLIGEKADDGQTYYLGTLILEVPIDASGTYTIGFLPDAIKTFMKDNYGQSIVPLILTPALITIKQPPNKPSVPTGTINGKAGVIYSYSSSTTDPGGDKIQYLFDWGDGQTSAWTDPVDSGQPGSASHAWSSQGSYPVKVKARDIPNFEESEWSEPLSVSMPKNKPYLNTPFLQFLQQHPNLFPLLRLLLKL